MRGDDDVRVGGVRIQRFYWVLVGVAKKKGHGVSSTWFTSLLLPILNPK